MSTMAAQFHLLPGLKPRECAVGVWHIMQLGAASLRASLQLTLFRCVALEGATGLHLDNVSKTEK